MRFFLKNHLEFLCFYCHCSEQMSVRRRWRLQTVACPRTPPPLPRSKAHLQYFVQKKKTKYKIDVKRSTQTNVERRRESQCLTICTNACQILLV